MSRLALALTGLTMLHPAHAASASGQTATYRQQANRACQEFFVATDSLSPGDAVLHGPWRRARRRTVAELRETARLILRRDGRLAAIDHPKRLDARWARLVASDRAAAQVLRATARRVAAARTRHAGLDALLAGDERYGVRSRRFRRLADRLGLNGCLRLDPTADVGLDPAATPAQRAAAAAFGAAAQRLRDAVVLQTPTINRQLAEVAAADCGSVLAGAPRRARAWAQNLVTLALYEALFGPIAPAFQRFDADLAAVHTSDRALVAGRALFTGFTSEFATLPSAPLEVCAALKAWRAQRWAAAAAPPIPPFVLQPVSDAEETRENHTSNVLALRLRELGVPVREIDYLVGDTLFDGVEAPGSGE